MKKTFIYISVAGLFSLASCTKDITALNEDTKKPSTVAASALYSSATKELSDAVTSTSVNLNVFRLFVQHWTETTYLDEVRYNIIKRSIPDAFWDALYTDALKDLAEAKSVVEANKTLNAATKANQLAQIEIMTVYAYSVAVNTFGNVPYSQTLDIDNLFPEYEDAQTIYLDLISRLDAALATFDESAEGFGAANMLFASNEIPSWTKFGYSLKLRLGMILADALPAEAATIVADAAPKAFDTQGEYAMFPYSTVPPNTNPLWEDLVQSGRHDFVGANTFVNVLNDLDDPRRPNYFTTINGAYIGGTYGLTSPYTSYSNPSALIQKKDLPGVFIDYSEVEFLRAEAIERGFSVAGTVVDHYNNAITNSIISWGGTAAEAALYLANPKVNYLTATGDYKQKIGMQKWIALYNRGFDAWVEVRRFDYPKLVAPPRAVSGVPVRFTYPVSEQNLNRTNYDAAAAAIGGDVVGTKLFWDKF